jgi:SAM-dependent methyltransferase
MWQAVVVRLDRFNRAHPWSHNDHYQRWVLRQIPPTAGMTLDVGCGTGNLVRALSPLVGAAHGIDSDPAVVALAQESSTGIRNVTFENRDLMDLPPIPAYDAVTAVAVVHHLPLAQALTQMRNILRPIGRIIIVGCYREETFTDYAVSLTALPVNAVMGFLKRKHISAARIAMSAPTAPAETSLREVRATARRILPGARIRRRLFWRYSLTYTKPRHPNNRHGRRPASVGNE